MLIFVLSSSFGASILTRFKDIISRAECHILFFRIPAKMWVGVGGGMVTAYPSVCTLGDTTTNNTIYYIYYLLYSNQEYNTFCLEHAMKHAARNAKGRVEGGGRWGLGGRGGATTSSCSDPSLYYLATTSTRWGDHQCHTWRKKSAVATKARKRVSIEEQRRKHQPPLQQTVAGAGDKAHKKG